MWILTTEKTGLSFALSSCMHRRIQRETEGGRRERERERESVSERGGGVGGGGGGKLELKTLFHKNCSLG